jgi:hypothetical protein
LRLFANNKQVIHTMMSTSPGNQAAPETNADPPSPTIRDSINPTPTPALAPTTLLPAAPVAAPPAAKGVTRESVSRFKSLMHAELLSNPEEERLRVCETAIQTGWQRFVEVGLALEEIRDNRLYRNNFNSFEEYCQTRWDFKHGKAKYLIAAARICRRLRELPDVPQPQRESQLRPLLSMAPEQVALAWQCAVQLGGNSPVTARLVKRAIKFLELPVPGPAPRPAPVERQTKRELRRKLSESLDEMLGLITRKADHSTLLQHFEALHQHVQLLLTPQRRKKP